MVPIRADKREQSLYSRREKPVFKIKDGEFLTDRRVLPTFAESCRLLPAVAAVATFAPSANERRR